MDPPVRRVEINSKNQDDAAFEPAMSRIRNKQSKMGWRSTLLLWFTVVLAWVNDVRAVQGKSGVRGIDGVWSQIYRCLFEFKLISKKSRRHNTNTWSPGLWSSRATSSGACALGLMRRGRFGRYSLSPPRRFNPAMASVQFGSSVLYATLVENSKIMPGIA
jgi:hypothetical protein